MSAPRYFRLRLVKGGPLAGVKIWRGHPVDPVTGETLTERPALWRAAVNGTDEPIEQVAPWFQDGIGDEMRGTEITEKDYRFYAADHAWAKEHAPDDPAAKPREKVDLNRLPTLF